MSNYEVSHLEELLDHATVHPTVLQVTVQMLLPGTRTQLLTHAYWLHHALQVEFHPQLYQRNLLQFCRDHNIQFQAYSSLGIGEVRWHGNKVYMLLNSPMRSVFLQLLGDEAIVKMAAKYSKTPAQLLLRWGIQHGTGGRSL